MFVVPATLALLLLALLLTARCARTIATTADAIRAMDPGNWQDAAAGVRGAARELSDAVDARHAR